MTSFPILDLVLGLVFIYFLFSIITSSFVEIILTVSKIRAKLMEDWLLKTFDKNSGALAKEIMNHSITKVLTDNDKSTSYIDAKNFATVLIEKVIGGVNVTSIDNIITKLTADTALPDEIKNALLLYANEAKEKFATSTTLTAIELFRSKIENWFDTSMDRVTGSLKERYSRKFTMVVAVVVVLSLNLDSVVIATYLYKTPAARTILADKGVAATKDPANKQLVENIKNINLPASNKDSLNKIIEVIEKDLKRIDTLKTALADEIPIGWDKCIYKEDKSKDYDFWWYFIWYSKKIIGLLASILAIMMGAPFWFDMLNKLANIRGVGTKPTTAEVKAKKDK